MNEIVLYLQEDHVKNTNHIFIYSDMNFYSFLSNRLKTRINSTWMNQVFAKLMKFSHYFTEMSDWTIYWNKNYNICYILVRINWLYKNFWIKKWWVIETVFPYSVIEDTISSIIALWWQIWWWKQSDTAITFWWLKYRLWIWKDWDRIVLVARRNWAVDVNVDVEKFLEDEWIVLTVKKLNYQKEQFTLQQTFQQDDIDVLLNYADQKKWLMIISWQTWSWKSVAMRNLLNYIFEKAQQRWFYRKIATFEDPIEVENPNYIQLEATKSELTKMLLFVKRADLDDALVWEIRNHEMLPGLLEASETISAYTTSHQANVSTWLQLLKN